jgi:hypothetical protein
VWKRKKCPTDFYTQKSVEKGKWEDRIKMIG